MEEMYIATGYPLGRLFEKDDIFLVQCKEQSYALNSHLYSTWILVWEHMTLEEVIKHSNDLGIQEKSIILESLDNLMELNLIIEIKQDNLELFYESIKNLTFDKQGLGIGHSPIGDSNYDFLINFNKNIRVNLLKYAIWCEGNLNKSIKEVIECISKDFELSYNNNLYIFVESILFLYQNKLIILKG